VGKRLGGGLGPAGFTPASEARRGSRALNMVISYLRFALADHQPDSHFRTYFH